MLFKAQPTPKRAVVGKTGVLSDRDPPDSAWAGTVGLTAAGRLGPGFFHTGQPWQWQSFTATPLVQSGSGGPLGVDKA